MHPEVQLSLLTDLCHSKQALAELPWQPELVLTQGLEIQTEAPWVELSLAHVLLGPLVQRCATQDIPSYLTRRALALQSPPWSREVSTSVEERTSGSRYGSPSSHHPAHLLVGWCMALLQDLESG
ncbi:hypothetical protein ACOMHN_004023 [Nucella lapillus]